MILNQFTNIDFLDIDQYHVCPHVTEEEDE